MIKTIKSLNVSEAGELFKMYSEHPSILDDFHVSDSRNDSLRKEILSIADSFGGEKNGYAFDYQFGLAFYQLMNQYSDFNETIASDYGFWRGLQMTVVPDLIRERWDDSEDHFFRKTNRIYLATLWWYIHLSFQGSMEETKRILEPLSSDYILQLVDRASQNGVYLEITRLIMKKLSLLSPSELNKKENGSNLFRRVMMQDVARRGNYNLLFENEAEVYVDELFKECGVNFHE